MYFGKEGGNVEKNLVWCVVRDFIVLIEGNNYYLYMDNFYCDFYLFIEWMNFGIYCCGIVRVGICFLCCNLVIIGFVMML